MELSPCDAATRDYLAFSLFRTEADGSLDQKLAEWVQKTFPDIILDVANHQNECETQDARNSNGIEAIHHQLKPFLMFSLVLGRCPQLTDLVYNYFEKSSFQPLPLNTFDVKNVTGPDGNQISEFKYNIPGFNDDLVIQLLKSYFKYLTFNPKWFSTIWNWALLGKFTTLHPNLNIRYLAACCLSVITKPTRLEHIEFIKRLDNEQSMIEVQIRHRKLYDNTFVPCLEANDQKTKALEFAKGFGQCVSYEHNTEPITKASNVLLLKRDTSLDSESTPVQYKQIIESYVPVDSLNDTLSRIAYSISINKPCLIRGPCGSGKTAVLDYLAAHTNRANPPDYVKIQIGDQIDSKLLIGSYVCTEIPGKFEWQPGPLSRAMIHGSWIVFEDIDSAPADMAQVIHSVIENGNLSCVSCCPIKLDMPHPDFRILFTQQVKSNNVTNQFSLGFGFIERLCDIVTLPELSDNNIQEILKTKYKFGDSLSEIVLQIYRTSQKAMEDLNVTRASRVVTLRDLFKFCDRITVYALRSDTKVASSDLESIFLDAIDCFLSAMSRSGELNKWAEQLGQIVNISADDVQRLIFQRKPDVREDSELFHAGRAKLKLPNKEPDQTLRYSTMAYTKQCLQLIESVSICVKTREPVLLVGETGVGKTSVVQHLANILGVELIVINLSQQSDSSDLLGGYKPVEFREIMLPIHVKFEELFRQTYDEKSNQLFLSDINGLFASAKTNSLWSTYLKLVRKMCITASRNIEAPSKRILQSWIELYEKVQILSTRIMTKNETTMALSFSEGSLLRAVKDGKWILLDEINLAEPDVLQCLLLILDSMKRKELYMYNASNSQEAIKIHPKFRIFACMNPSTDIGKRDLAIGTRGRFTEFYVDDVIDKPDLRLITESYVKTCLTPVQIESIVKFYQEVRSRTPVLSDISGNAPIYSLRTLCRSLTICSNNVCRNIEKSLFESLKITFLQQLNDASIQQVTNLITQIVFNKKSAKSFEEIEVPCPKDNHQYIPVEGFWIQRSNEEPMADERYILTKSVERNLQSLARIISLSQRRLPILIQGNTSVGKTSLITYLAKLTGNRCYRINNHEHTDLQEYVGQYILRDDGELFFQEGLLVRALKKGYWIILDELNLAPSELLEALNRVLDDNRELFIPETRETIRAHSKFMLFATQNPPEEYAGRKLLSRAFRNRFIELHFDEIPGNELEYILEKRCTLAPKYAKKIVMVMRELQMFRRESGCFNGKNGFMTMRDLFRWGQRYETFKSHVPDNQFFDWDKALAKEGLILLEGRVRTSNEAEIVKSIIEKVFKVVLKYEEVYDEEYNSSKLPSEFKHIQFTQEFKKLFIQLTHAFKYKEPVLLCGQTGCGKTTACQLYAALKKQDLFTYNCHQNTESSDFVGGVRPSREETRGSSIPIQKFPWINGPLVEAMKTGSIFLMDEISLADDAVLERINSVLEPARSITLTEKNGDEIFAKEPFRLVATMNPGGDYGKKELSAALRNRFTEIYCHNTTDLYQVRKIIQSCLVGPLLKSKFLSKMLSVMQNFLKEYYTGDQTISIRDVKSWADFINKTTNVDQPRPLSLQEALLNGASLVFFDQFGTCGHSMSSMSDNRSKSRLRSLLKKFISQKFDSEPQYCDKLPATHILHQDIVIFKKFVLQKGPEPIFDSVNREFIVDAPIVKKNLMKIVRAMQLNRPILLEGDPGAGKTTIVGALSKLTGHKLVRINLSEQTDISDLFGSDLPDTSCGVNESSESQDTPRFSWHDGPMLQAIKQSQWILLDEMNLASQSVLEGLNACFDHRGEIFIPELNKKFKINQNTTRIFACQNPYNQGAARKGLPQSFLNRFTSIFIESHSPQDMVVIVSKLYPGLPHDLIEKMIEFNYEVSANYQCHGFEFNLRDIIYWCDLMTKYVHNDGNIKVTNINDLYRPDRFVQFIYLDRLRLQFQKDELIELYDRIFNYPVYVPPYRELRLGEHSFILGRATLPRKVRVPPHLSDLTILRYQMPYLESLAKAIESNKMPILVGEFGVGKRSMVRILAGLTGNELNIIGANREMDTVELLGSYEQKGLQREVVGLVEESKKCVMSMINAISCKTSANDWTKLFAHIWQTLYMASGRETELSSSESLEAYFFQLTEMKELVEKLSSIAPVSDPDQCKSLVTKIDNLISKSLKDRDAMYSSGNFEWIDSILIKSIREGTWLMIENANLMNPATLDRLNSLVESNGCLSLNEKGSGPNGIETLVPHPDFRLILTINPEFGELSRAMRNRGVEIFVQLKFFFEDFLILLNMNGFEPEENKVCMAYCIMQTTHDVHSKLTGEDPTGEEGGILLAYFGLNYIPLLVHHVRRGIAIDNILVDLLTSFYSQKGYMEECNESLRAFILERLDEYRKTFQVKRVDERYRWLQFRHDLVSLTGGDAITAMLARENNIFFDDVNLDVLLKPEEKIENTDIVNTCITIKLFLENSTHGDFEYREGFIRETYGNLEQLLNRVNSHVDELRKDYEKIMEKLMPIRNIITISDIPVDSRMAPDIHYNLMMLDYEGTKQRERLMNKWVLSLNRIMLRMIGDVTMDLTAVEEQDSLYNMSEQVRIGKLLKEDLVRPTAAIASDLVDLLTGLVRAVSEREFDNETVIKIFPKFFWIHYFITKLKRGYVKYEQIAVCNQIPMLWTLTYHKVIVPLTRICDIADLPYRNKKFSVRIEEICAFLNVNTNKPGNVEKSYYKKVVNLYAATTKRSEFVSREVDKFFATLASEYTNRAHADPQSFMVQNSKKDMSIDHLQDPASFISRQEATLAHAVVIWSNKGYMDKMYEIEGMLVSMDMAESINDEARAKLFETEARNSLIERLQSYEEHKNWYDRNDGYTKSDIYKNKHLYLNKRMTALDQFAPVWQLNFIQFRLAKLSAEVNAPAQGELMRDMLKRVNGLVMSPRYYGTICKYYYTLMCRSSNSPSTQNESNTEDECATLKKDLDMYTAFLADHFMENVVLDHQIVGWTKLRVTTSDLPAMAPIVPEYSPIVSLVGSYCLDLGHLKLNSYTNPSAQLESMLVYLWRHYALIKLNVHKDSLGLELANNLIHLRCRTHLKEELIGSHECEKVDCTCIHQYIKRRVPTYETLIETMNQKLIPEDLEITLKSIDLIYFGYLNLLEYAPIFTLDPSMRAQEILGVYNAELAHIKLELHFRETLSYWKTGDALLLTEIGIEDVGDYPFPIQMLIDRRVRLEKSIRKLKREHTNRPRSDDASMYFELRRDVEVNIQRYTTQIQSIMSNLVDYVQSPNKPEIRLSKFKNLYTNVRRIIKNCERMIIRLRSEYRLYTDLTTNFLVGMCFVQQGLRCLHSRLEQRMEVYEKFNFGYSIQKYLTDVTKAFSFNNLLQENLASVYNKLNILRHLSKICPEDKVSQIQSILLKTVLIQLNHHITITPSDIQKCIPIVRLVADQFHAAWLKRKLYMEEQRKLKEELYQYKTVRTSVGTEISFERQEFLDMCAKFPTYDHVFQSFDHSKQLTSAELDNLKTEERMCNMNRSVDLSMCIDVCKAHYKFIKEASYNLLGQANDQVDQLPVIDMSHLIKLEAETLYTITRHCIPTLDSSFDSAILECHLLQANHMIKTFRKTKEDQCKTSPGSLKSSLEILDEEIFDIYHHSNAQETLKFQEFILEVDNRVRHLRNSKNYDSHTTLTQITKLTTKISSFLITDPMMKFITGGHTLLGVMEEWNKQSISKEDKLINEVDELVNLIKSWRSLEIDSWRSSLHRVKRNYIDNTLCDLWFKLYEAFNDPITTVIQLLQEKFGAEISLNQDFDHYLYEGFILFIKDFLEDSTLGDYQIRLDLVFSFAIQTRFTSFKKLHKKSLIDINDGPKINFEKLNTYVYNTHRQYQGIFEYLKEVVDFEEAELTKELNQEIRIVAWQGRNLWDIKNNFRISHRKLNKVMNKYLEVLRRPLPPIKASVFTKLQPMTTQLGLNGNGVESRIEVMVDSSSLNMTLASIQLLIQNIKPPSKNDELILGIDSLKKTPIIVIKMKHIYKEMHEKMVQRHIDNLIAIEDTATGHRTAIENFYSHKVQEVVLDPKDSKETRAEKQKLCRQMHHSKKFAMQSVFKSLQTLGVSHQRGLNQIEAMDKHILALEPLRGLIRTQSRLVLKSAQELVNDDMIMQCNNMYSKLLAKMTYLLAKENEANLTSDQVERIRGYTVDLALGVIQHNESAALIYKHLIGIQAAVARLTSLQKNTKTQEIVVYNFNQFHQLVQQFDEIVGRTYLAISKLEKLVECCSLAADLETYSSSDESGERNILNKLIDDMDKQYPGGTNSLMTNDQQRHIKSNLLDARKNIASVSHNLRDMLNNTCKNHVYSRDDLAHLESLYKQFHEALSYLIPNENDDDECDEEPVVANNFKPGTALGSFNSLLAEAERELRPKLDQSFWESKGEANVVNIEDHPNLEKLNLRLRRLIRETQLAVQEVYKEELNFTADIAAASAQGEAMKRKLKPFNYLNTGRVENLLRSKRVAHFAGNCFATLNREKTITNIRPIITGLTPIVSIYTQDVACYLNIILTSLFVKLKAANQLMPFFTDLIVNGFGLPYKVSGPDESGAEPSKGKMSEDNVGFGEGKGDKDASKKLEFESQLDDLKTDKEEEADKENEQETVKAHDDGIEMSDDIDAKAEGPEDGAEADADDKSQQDEDEQDDALNELDKEMDTVDQDEGKLDQKLWDEEDAPLGEDDESDLRETDVDGTMDPNKEDGTELEAKDDQLSTAKSDKKESAKDDDKSSADAPKPDEQKDDEMTGDEAEKDDTVAVNEKKIDPAADNEEPDAQESDDIQKAPDENDQNQEVEELDLDDEAAQATKEQDHSAQEGRDDSQLDMSMSEDDDEGADDLADEDLMKVESGKDEDAKSEGELSMDDEDEEVPADGAEELINAGDGKGSQDPINDDEIDNKLEELLSTNAALNDRGDNQQSILSLPATGGGVNKKEEPKEMKGRVVGHHVVYDIYAEDDDDPLDYDEIDQPHEEEQDSGTSAEKTVDSSKERYAEKSSAEKEQEKTSTQDAGVGEDSNKAPAMETDALSDISLPEHEMPIDDNLIDEDSRGDRDKADKSKPKRTFADRDEEDEKGLKRQRILEAEEKEKKSKNENEHDKEQRKQSPPGGKARHIDQDKSGAFEMIDLVSSSDDEDVPKLKSSKSVQEPETSDPSSDDISADKTKEDLMEQIDSELNKKPTTEYDSVDTDRLTNLWLDCTRQTNHLVHELCQRLQIVLQPTKMSKYRGDYKSGKRLNMRKIISYIASNYRKDKIWLRRTKPSKRTYNITLAVDNSRSMSENNCRQMTYQSLALLAKSLSLMEAGSLSVVSFGEQVKCIHEFGQPYMDAIGAQWLRELRFNESRTSYQKMLKHSIDAFAKQAQATQSQLNIQGSIYQLLVIISDGRNVTSEEEEVRMHLRELKSMGVLTLFVIIDDLKMNEGKSLVDVKRCFGFGSNIQMLSYMELFPFPFYVLLRQLDTMPSILGDSLRQWFELVSSANQ